MNGRLPLPSLLSHALVAFTIEFDNEFEHRVPHRTTNHGSTGSRSSPWLVSMAMWLKFMRFVPAEGIPVRELQRLTRFTANEMRTWLTRMGKWWGYVVVEPNAPDSAPSRSLLDWVVRPTPGGRKSLETWQPLTGIIEKRWQKRFGKDIVDRLQELLQTLVDEFDGDLPDCLPILGYDLFSTVSDREKRTPADAALSKYTLPMLISKILLAFAIEFESDAGLPLAISSNVLRVIGEDGARTRDLPRLAGISKEAVAVSLGRLDERSLTVVQSESPGSRVKIVKITAKGRTAQDASHRLLRAVEQRWQSRFGEGTVDNLRETLEHLDGDGTARLSPLFRGLEPYPDGWRAAVPRPEGLPHYPMMLHRGGFPDGS